MPGIIRSKKWKKRSKIRRGHEQTQSQCQQQTCSAGEGFHLLDCQKGEVRPEEKSVVRWPVGEILSR
jgi:hypothetical protein